MKVLFDTSVLVAAFSDRLNIAYEDAGSFRDRVLTERFFFALFFTYRLGENTTLNLDVVLSDNF